MIRALVKNPILSVRDLTMRFGGLDAVKKITLEIAEDEIVSLIGPNGAGKTTLFNCITGIYTPTSGIIEYNPSGIYSNSDTTHHINGKKPHEVVGLGLARTFQNVRLFKELTILENVLVGFQSRLRMSLPGVLLQTHKNSLEEKEIVATSLEILKYFKLDTHAHTRAKNLPYGKQKELEIARALATKSKMLFLDEPVAGLNTQETDLLRNLIAKIREEFQLTILLIEHDMNFVMNFSQRIYVMDYGELIAVGTPDEIRSNPAVIAAYLGE